MKHITATLRATVTLLLAATLPAELNAENSASNETGVNPGVSTCGVLLTAPSHVCRNVDDDQPGTHADHEKWDINDEKSPPDNENDLEPIVIKGSTTLQNVTMSLIILPESTGKVRLWKYPDKTGELKTANDLTCDESA